MERDEAQSAPGGSLFGGGRREERGRNSNLFNCCGCFNTKPNNINNNWSVEQGRSETPTPPRKESCFSPPPLTLWRRVGAEFIGTMVLIFAGTGTAIVNQKSGGSEGIIGIAGSNGLAVMIVILSTGHISGAHLNPAITIAFAALNRFPWKYVPIYVGTQVGASVCASMALKWLFHPIMDGGVTVPTCSNAQAFVLEFLLTTFLMFVVTAVATDSRTVRELGGIAVGATVMLNILVAGEVTGASMNPVRSLGPAVAANNFKSIWVYMTAPFLGALFGAGLFSLVKLPMPTS